MSTEKQLSDAAGRPMSVGESQGWVFLRDLGGDDDPEGAPTFRYSPDKARALAAALDRAADEAESGVSEEARLRLELAAIDDALRDAGIEYPLGARGVRDLAEMLKLARDDEDRD